MITNIITHTGTNVLKVGTALLLSSLASTALKQASNETMETMAKDIRKLRTSFNDRKLQAGA